MDWVPTALMLMAITLLTVQGVVLLSQDKHKLTAAYPHRSYLHLLFAGGVNLVLALFALFAYFLFASGALILSPEFGVLLAQGRLAWLWAIAIVLGITVGVAGLLHVVRTANSIPSSEIGLLAGGCVAACVALLRAQVLDRDQPAAFRIRCLDLWSYFFLAWIVTMLTLWVLIVVHQNRAGISWRRRLLGVVFMLTLCGLAATYHRTVGLVFADTWTLRLWRATVWLGVPIFMGTLTWSSFGIRQSKLRTSVSVLASALAAAAGVFSAYRWMQYVDGWQSWTTIRIALVECFTIWALWVIFLGLRRGIEWFRCTIRSEAAAHGTAAFSSILGKVPGELKRSLQNLPDIGNPGRRDDVIALICFGTMVGSIVDMSHSARLDPIWDLTALITSWLILSEIIAVYPLCHALKDLLNRFKTDEAFFANSWKKLKKPLGWLLTPIRWLFSAETKTGAALKIAIFLVVVIAVAEIPNAGKTVVLSFSSTDLGADAQGKDNSNADSQKMSKEFGRLVSERVVNTIGVVGKDIRPSLMVADPNAKGDEKVAWIPASGDATNNVQAAFANSSIQIPGTQTTLPLSGVVLSIQELSRWVLGVRQISGSVQKQGDQYVLLASSSTGDTWRVTWPPPKAEDTASAAAAAKAQRTPITGGNKNQADRKGAETAPGAASGHTPSKKGVQSAPDVKFTELAAVEALADKLAYKIITSDRRLQSLGVTSVPEAMADFSAGVSEWRTFEVDNDEKVLTESIVHFHNAVDLDSQFSLAYYRLGQAYLSDGQPRAAADAFRESVKTNPKFVAGYIALAATLYLFDLYYYPMPAAVAPSDRVNNYDEAARERDQKEAREELETVIGELGPSLNGTFRAAAYLGLCRDAYERYERYDLSPSQRARYIAFFYCRRAEYLYTRLPADVRSDPTYKNKEVTLLARLGGMLDPYQRFAPHATLKWEPGLEPGIWLCDPRAANELVAGGVVMPYNTYAKASQRYYEKALAEAPDDVDLRCKYARMLIAHRNDDQMRQLAYDENAHLAMAESLDEQGRFAGALDEVNLAIVFAPYDPEALNAYAYITYQWYWNSLQYEDVEGPSWRNLTDAVALAQTAVHLTEDKGSRKDHGVYQSSLGELQLAAANFDRAYRTLHEIFFPYKLPGESYRPPDVGDQALYDEIRWDLVQAATCTGLNRGATKEQKALVKKYLDTIAQHEKTREDQRFTGVLEVSQLVDDCHEFTKAATSAWRASQQPPGGSSAAK